MNTKQILIALGVVVLVVVAVFAFKKPANKVPGSSETFKIGAALSLTGAASADGESLKKGIEFAREELAKKGVNVEVVYQDDRSEAKDTISAVNALGSQNIAALIGPTWSFLGDAAAPTIDRLKLVSLMPVTTTEVVTAKSDYLFHGSLKNALMEEDFAAFIKEKNIAKIAYIGNNDAWSTSIASALKKAAASTGAQVVVDEEVSYGSEAASVPTLLTKVKQQNADAIIFSIFDDQGITKLVSSARQQGIMVPIVATDTGMRRVISNGLLAGTSLENLYNVTPASDGAFDKAYEARYGEKPTTFTDRGYDALMVLVDALQNKGDMSLNEYLKTKTNYKGYAATYAFDENGDVKGGDWKLAPIQ